MKITKDTLKYYVNKFSNDLKITKKEAKRKLTENVNCFKKFK